jgi:hypothetical protein
MAQGIYSCGSQDGYSSAQLYNSQTKISKSENLELYFFPDIFSRNQHTMFLKTNFISPISLKIYTLQGKLCHVSLHDASENEIQIPILETGLYLCEIVSGKYIIRKKIAYL